MSKNDKNEAYCLSHAGQGFDLHGITVNKLLFPFCLLGNEEEAYMAC